MGCFVGCSRTHARMRDGGAVRHRYLTLPRARVGACSGAPIASGHTPRRPCPEVTVGRNAANARIEAVVLALDAVKRVLDGKAPKR